MATRKEIEDQMAALQQQLDTADEDEDYEVWIKNDKGAETRIPSKKAGGYLKEHFGIDLHPAPADPADPADPQDPKEPQDPKPGGGGYFSKRKG